MTTRWDVERAVLAADLPPTSRLILLVLLTQADNDTAIVPEWRTPSLTDLEHMTGRARSTVCVHLAALEATDEQDGWIIRTRPDPYEARTKHVRTKYALRIPAALIHTPDPDPKLVRPKDEPGPDTDQGLVRPKDEAGPAPGRNIPLSPPSLPPSRARARAWEEDCLSSIEETLRELAPARVDAHTREWAQRVLQGIALGGVKSKVAYVETVIRNNPEMYLPTRGEPSVAEALAAAIPREDTHA